jgi:L,D-peptidoglycan transpeptidase YkuD (ErfK/YbiS/YcfS/YnhG family)
VIVKDRKRKFINNNRHIIAVRTLSRAATHGVLTIGHSAFPCRLGRSGLSGRKREGDGATPLGEFALRRIFFRPDRMPRPVVRPAALVLDPRLGWCDDPAAPLYNRPVRLPTPWRHEKMWREDGLYDFVLEIGYNDAPVRRGMGSAIFLHLMAEDHRPTEGCIALSRRDINRLVARLTPGTRISIG